MADPLPSHRPRHPTRLAAAANAGHPDTVQPHGTQPPPGPAAGPGPVLQPGVRPLPDYELLQMLGRGGFGEVWKATGPGGFELALKFIRLGDQAGRIELRSLELMRNIRHAHLLPLFSAWQREDLLIIAMELADHTLLHRLHQANDQGLPGIPFDELFEYMREAAKGLDFLNEPRHPSGTGALVGIQHKDIKPQNLLLVGGTVKVADFGLAKLLEHTVIMASGGLTPAYAAPEFLQGQATRWSDQYCLAVTYCHLRGGRLPFGGNAVQIMAGHMLQSPDLEMLPEAERPIVARALGKKPEERWPSCRAFIEALAQTPAASLLVDRSASTSALPVFQSAWSAPPPPVPPLLLAEADRPPSRAASRPARAEPSAPRPPAQASPPPPEPLARWRKFLLGTVLTLLALPVPALCLWSILARDGTISAPGSSDGTTRSATPGSEDSTRGSIDSPLRGSSAGAPEGRISKAPGAAQRNPGEGGAQRNPGTSLQLLAITPLTLDTGKHSGIEVRVQRRNCQGAVRLDVEGLPDRVRAEPVTLAPDQTVAHLQLTAGEDAQEAVRTAQVLASLGTLQTRQPLPVTVRVTPALRLSLPEEVVLQAGEGTAFYVGLERRNSRGPVQLRVESLPHGVNVRPGSIPGDQTAGRMELTASDDTAAMVRTARLLAVADDAGGTAELRLRILDDRVRRKRTLTALNDRARAHLEHHEYAKAIDDYSKVLQVDPNNATVYAHRALAYARGRHLEKTLADCDRAIQLDPNCALAYAYRGYAFWRKGNHDQTLADCDRAIQLDPRCAVAYAQRGLAHARKKEWDRALADCDQAIQLDPNCAWFHNQRGIVWRDRQDENRAIADFTEAVRLDPRYAAAFNNRGKSYMALKEYDRAIEDFTRAIELDPQFSRAYANRARAHWNNDEPRRAIPDCDQAIRLDPSSSRAYNTRGLARAALKESGKAIEDFTRAIHLDPYYASPHNNRGSSYLTLKQYGRALEDYDEAIRLDPRDAFAYDGRGNVYLQMKKYTRALEDFTEAIRLDPTFAGAYNDRGVAHWRQGNTSSAIADYTRAIRLNPRFALAYANRSLAYRKQGHKAQADADRKQALRLDPSLRK